MADRSSSGKESLAPAVDPEAVRAMANALAGNIRGRIIHGARRLRRKGSDFGQLITRRPGLIVSPASEEDVLLVLEQARRFRVPVTIQGAGCSCNGQSLSDGGVLISNVDDRPEPPRRASDDCFEVSARSRWAEVDTGLAPHGLSVPVLADNLRLTVGGTLSVGGYGIDSIVHGAQVRQVERLRVIRPRGDALWCSRDEHSDLFRHALAGQGRVGIIEKAVIRTAAHRPYSTMFTCEYSDLRELAESAEWLCSASPDRPDFFKAFQARGKTRAVYGYYSDGLRQARARQAPRELSDQPAVSRRVYPAYRKLRSLSVAMWVAHYGPRLRPWNDYLVDYQGLRQLVAKIEELREQRAFGSSLRSVYLLAVRRPERDIHIPFEAAGVGADPMWFGVGVYSMVSRRNHEELEKVLAAGRICLETCLQTGGRPYLYGWHELDAHSMQELYGADSAELRRLRSEGDPDGIMASPKTVREF